jgi:hypothetical protein
MKTEDGNNCVLTHTRQDINLAAGETRQTYWINHTVDETHPLIFETLSISRAEGKTDTTAFAPEGFATVESKLFGNDKKSISLVQRVMNNLGISCTNASGEPIVPYFTLKDIEGLKRSKEDSAPSK